MKLYHGSDSMIREPDVDHSRGKVDFGHGFYTTPVYEQALKWAARFKDSGRAAYISVYDFDEGALASLRVLSFPEHDGAWLDFITECRLGNDTGEYDLVRGGVANDKVFDTCELYFKGLIAKETAIERLKFAEPNLQLCFKNNRTIRNTLFYSETVAL